MSKLPAMMLYTGDWLKDPAVSFCAPATRGIWIDLICAMHESDRSGELRGTREQLARIARCSTVELDAALTDLQTSKAADVTDRNGVVTLTNRRMNREFLARKEAARRQAECRSRDSHTKVTPPSSYSPSDSQHKTPPNPPAKPGGGCVGFDRFWEAYPSGPTGRKGGRSHTLKSWIKQECEPLANQIVAAVKLLAASPDWQRDGGRYIPGAATWLNQRRWEAVDTAKSVAPDPASRQRAERFIVAWKRMDSDAKAALAKSAGLTVARIDESVRWQQPAQAAVEAWAKEAA